MQGEWWRVRIPDGWDAGRDVYTGMVSVFVFVFVFVFFQFLEYALVRIIQYTAQQR